MKTTCGLCLALLLAGVANRSSACGDDSSMLQHWAEEAVAADPAVSGPAIDALRTSGPEGLETLLELQDQLAEQSKSVAWSPEAVELHERQGRLLAALDAVGGQRDCATSRLYWHTDLEAAKAQAQATGKPILSLRLLGNLTDEFSCANSRFFRTTLYANAQVSQVLRERFVLHWQSVRPVPKVTIDFGDSRKLERTLTGNSIHYVLDNQGRPIEALPGLYGPAAFLRALDEAEAAAYNSAALGPEAYAEFVRAYHLDQLDRVNRSWRADLQQLGVTVPPEILAAEYKGNAKTIKAAVIAASKADVELPILETVFTAGRTLNDATTEETWARIAALYGADAELDAASRALMRQQLGAAIAAPVARTKAVVEDPLVRMVRQFQNSIALDTVRNEYVLHRQIHEWFARGEGIGDLDRLNERVYAELFLTPSSDPWLGLVPQDTYTALEHGGVIE